MFDTNIKISVIAANGVGNEVLLKPRSAKKLAFAGKVKQQNLRRELTKSFEDYDAVLSENSWFVLLYLAENTAKGPAELSRLVHNTNENSDGLASEFRYRLEWLVQLGLLERSAPNYEISTVGKALIEIAKTKELSTDTLHSQFLRAERRLEEASAPKMLR